MVVTKAIIPAAGRGSRLAPITHSIPKELLCVGAVPLIEWALRHCLAAAVTEVAIVTSPDKPLLRTYIEQLALPLVLHWVEQPQPLGSGEALWRCREFAAADPCVVYMPDEWALKPELSTLIDRYAGGVSLLLSWVTPTWAAYLPGVGRIRYRAAHVAAQPPTAEHPSADHHNANHYSSHRHTSRSIERAVHITELLPKVTTPFPAAPTGSLKGVGIGIVPPAFFAHLDRRYWAWQNQPNPAPELDDVATWQAFAASGELWGYRAESLIIDAGNPVGLAAANRYWLEHRRGEDSV